MCSAFVFTEHILFVLMSLFPKTIVMSIVLTPLLPNSLTPKKQLLISLLLPQEIQRTLHDAVGIKSVMPEDFLICSVNHVFVGYTEYSHGNRIFRNNLRHHCSKTAEHAVLLDGYYPPGVGSSLVNFLKSFLTLML